jgi:hypothetical protein
MRFVVVVVAGVLIVGTIARAKAGDVEFRQAQQGQGRGRDKRNGKNVTGKGMMSVVFLVFLAVVASRRGAGATEGDERLLRKVAWPWFEGKDSRGGKSARQGKSITQHGGPTRQARGDIYRCTDKQDQAVTVRAALSLEDEDWPLTVAGTCIQICLAGIPNQNSSFPVRSTV